jgi:hypothetical protein
MEKCFHFLEAKSHGKQRESSLEELVIPFWNRAGCIGESKEEVMQGETEGFYRVLIFQGRSPI